MAQVRDDGDAELLELAECEGQANGSKPELLGRLLEVGKRRRGLKLVLDYLGKPLLDVCGGGTDRRSRGLPGRAGSV